MKKSLVALAVLASAGAASAQSSVTLFGVVDAGISHYTTKTRFFNNNDVAVANFKSSQTVMSNSGLNSSRLGFRGTEDLGGGLAASFWLEAGLNNDTGLGGATGGAFAFNRRSTVSLSGGFGEVRLGRDYVPSFWNDTVFDPFGTNGVGTNLISSVNVNLGIARGPGSVAGISDNAVRSNNSIGYFLPPNLGGFYGQLMYSLGEGVNVNNVAGSPSQRGRYFGGRFGYANGPLDVAVAYGQNTARDLTNSIINPVTLAVTAAPGFNSDGRITTVNLGASYDFGPIKLFGELSRVEDRQDIVTPVAFSTNKDRYNGALLGVTVPVGAGLIRASVSRVAYKNGEENFALGNSDVDGSANKFAVGYVHNLSKRTALYATAAMVRVKNGENNPAVLSAVTGGPSYTVTPSATGYYAPRSSMGYDFGIKHTF